MRSVLETCQPRSDILTGSFNPEIFTASLSPVVDHYRGSTTTARKVVTSGSGFDVVHDVAAPEHIPDKVDRPQVALIALDAEAMVTTCGPNRPRRYQNLVFLLVTETVHVTGGPVEGGSRPPWPGGPQPPPGVERMLERLRTGA